EPISALADSDPDAWAAAADINFKGVYNGIRAATDVMGEGGVIINISSGAATNPLDGWSHYCASKAAALMLTRCGDKELAERGIRVVGLSPGTVATEMQVSIKASGINPVSKLEMSDHISPEAVANALLWLATEGYASYAGGDFSLRTPEGRAAAGLPPV
ncbi:MAG: SDR family oxidoreductase, partial [Planctomycetota bacterium]